jgi:hypothetical protein
MADIPSSHDDRATPWMKKGLRAKDYIAIKSAIVGGWDASVTQLRQSSAA